MLLRERSLRHAEAPERPGRDEMRVHRPRQRPVMRHVIGAGGVDRHPVGDGRPPGRVGAGVEVALEVERDEAPLRIGSRAQADAPRMALRRRADGFGSRIGHPHRPAERPGGERDEGLDGEVELGAEAAADGGRHDADVLGRDAEDLGHVVAVHVGRLGAGVDLDAVADAAGEAGLGLDRRVFHEAGLERALGRRGRGRERRLDVAPHDAPAREDVAGPPRMQQRRVRRERRRHRGRGRQVPPGDRDVGEVERADDGRIADDRRHRLAAEARLRLGEDGLVGEGRDDAVAVQARHVAGGEDRGDAGMRRRIGGEVAEREGRPVVGTAHRPQQERIGGADIGAEPFRALDLAAPVEPDDAIADTARLGIGTEGPGLGGVEHGRDDLAVAGAAAEHAAQGVLDRVPVRTRLAPEQGGRGHQHAGRAEAALRRAVAQEGGLQGARRPATLRQALDRRDLAPGCLRAGDQAGAGDLAVDHHRAGAAIAGVAAELGAGKPELVAQSGQKAGLRRPLQTGRRAVHGEGEGHGSAAVQASSARRTSSAAASAR